MSSGRTEKDLLKYSWMRAKKKFKILNNPLRTTNPMVNTIGLQGIAKKIDTYANCDEFLTDIDALVRSYSIQCGAQPEFKEAINELSELFHRDVKSIRTCSECFEYWALDPADYFTKVCSKPHLIVYAKAQGFPRWPAKVMSINGNIVNVEFFGDHTQADVPAGNCFLYANRHSVEGKNTTKFKKAQLELAHHISKLEEKFGPLKLAGTKVVLDPRNAEKQLMDMIPGAFKQRDESSGITTPLNIESSSLKFNQKRKAETSTGLGSNSEGAM